MSFPFICGNISTAPVYEYISFSRYNIIELVVPIMIILIEIRTRTTEPRVPVDKLKFYSRYHDLVTCCEISLSRVITDMFSFS